MRPTTLVEGEVLIGDRDVNSYVLALQTQAGRTNRLIVKARGKRIPKAIDIVEYSLRKFLTGWEKGIVVVGTEERPPPWPDEDLADKGRVSFIYIALHQGDNS